MTTQNYLILLYCVQRHVPGVENIQLYDPVFILRFSIHALSMGYIESVEFAGLGLLAVAFVSMSSPDVGMRKLGYELIGKYKNVLEVILSSMLLLAHAELEIPMACYSEWWIAHLIYSIFL